MSTDNTAVSVSHGWKVVSKPHDCILWSINGELKKLFKNKWYLIFFYQYWKACQA